MNVFKPWSAEKAKEIEKKKKLVCKKFWNNNHGEEQNKK